MRSFIRERILFSVFTFVIASSAHAWDDHNRITRLALNAYENWPTESYEPIENVLGDLVIERPAAYAPVDGSSIISQKKAFGSLSEFVAYLKVNGQKIKWDWQSLAPATQIDVLAYSVDEADAGMDQELNLSADQKFMGGYTGLASQAIRHMYYRAWYPLSPLVTFHYPFHEMGMAPERAKMFFNLAVQAKAKGHVFWAHRFLGWGLHYVQDLCQPYHTTQFASFTLLPLKVLIKFGWEFFIKETTRIVSNFHLSFEEYIKFVLLKPEQTDLHLAFIVPKGNAEMKTVLEQNLEMGVASGSKVVALASSELASEVVSKQKDLMGHELSNPSLNLGDGFRDAAGNLKIDVEKMNTENNLEAARKGLHSVAFEALSNTSIATRWYVDKFRATDREE